jgi:hypothetical protein
MQTSFMHPPFGFALFYLRSVAPNAPYIDKVTGRRMPPVTTAQIYWGAVPFVLIQCVMVALLIAFPGLVRHDKAPAPGDPPRRIEQPVRAPSLDSSKLELPPYPPAIPGAAAPESSGPGAPTLDFSVPPVILPAR